MRKEIERRDNNMRKGIVFIVREPMKNIKQQMADKTHQNIKLFKAIKIHQSLIHKMKKHYYLGQVLGCESHIHK